VWQQVDMILDKERIKEAVETLPPEQREAVMLAYFGGLTHPEIAERTGVPLGTVKGRLRLAMQKLRNLLAECDTEVPH
jgi:RNA polymerase sigma-70 factor (ECF subfamily)